MKKYFSVYDNNDYHHHHDNNSHSSSGDDDDDDDAAESFKICLLHLVSSKRTHVYMDHAL